MTQGQDSAAAKVFISHSHLDRDVATNLHRVLDKHQAQTYVDQDRIQAGDVLPDRIRHGIEWCNAFLLLWSANAARSDWVGREWNMAYDLRKKIIPYCMDSTPLPSLLDNLVYVDRKDEQRSHAGLLRAVLGRSFTPSPTELFPGAWRVTLSAFGLGTATYDLELRANGQITGTGKMDQGGAIGEMLAAQGMAGLLNMQSSVSGDWEYEEHTEILTLNLAAHGLGQKFQETIQIRTTGRERGEIRGQDFAGRDYVIKREPAVREIRAALLELRDTLARFNDADLRSDTFKDEIEIVLAAFDAAAPYQAALRSSTPVQPRKGASLDEVLRKLPATEEGLETSSTVAKVLVAGFLKKIDERLRNLPSQG